MQDVRLRRGAVCKSNGPVGRRSDSCKFGAIGSCAEICCQEVEPAASASPILNRLPLQRSFFGHSHAIQPDIVSDGAKGWFESLVSRLYSSAIIEVFFKSVANASFAARKLTLQSGVHEGHHHLSSLTSMLIPTKLLGAFFLLVTCRYNRCVIGLTRKMNPSARGASA
jgi:hypothetical protein